MGILQKRANEAESFKVERDAAWVELEKMKGEFFARELELATRENELTEKARELETL